MPCIIKEANISILQLATESLDCAIEVALVEINLGTASDQRKTKCFECLGHGIGIVCRIVDLWDVTVTRVADNEGDSLFGEGFAAQQPKARSEYNGAIPAHALSL